MKGITESDDLMDEILYGKKTTAQKNGLAPEPDDDLPDKDLGYSKDEQDAVNDVLYGKKKSKPESTEKTEKPAGKKFDREEYFGL